MQSSIINCYDWLIDREPSNLRYTKIGDVTRGVEVGMEFEPAPFTDIIVSFSIGFADKPATRTFLACISGVDVDHSFAKCFGFVVDKYLQLSERPITKHPIEVMSDPFLSFYAEFFERNSITGLIDDVVSDLVVNIRHKPLFPTRQAFQFTLGRRSAFCLKFTAQIAISAFNSPDVFAIEELVIGKHGMIIDSGIDTENSISFFDNWTVSFSYHLEFEFVPIVGKPRITDIPSNIFSKIVGNINFEFDPAINTAERCLRFGNIEREGANIISDSRMWSFCWQPFEFLSFQHLRRIIPGTSDQRSREFILFSDRIVSSVVEFEFIIGWNPISNPHDVVDRFVVCFNSADKVNIGFNINSNSSSHVNLISSQGIYNLSGGVGETTNEVFSFRPKEQYPN